MMLLIMTHMVNKAIISHGATTAKTLGAASAQITSDISLLRAADSFATGPSPTPGALQAAIAEYREINALLPRSNLWSEPLQSHFFLSNGGLQPKIDHYLTLVGELAALPPMSRGEAMDELRRYHASNAITEAHQKTLQLIETASDFRSAQLSETQQKLLLTSVLVLLAEAVFIFLPAQIAVRSSMRTLHHKTETMKKSKLQLREMNRKLEYLLNHDALTGLPNRSSVVGFLNGLLRSHPNISLGVLFVGIDDFKSLNDAVGHDYGDTILCAVARRLETCIDSEETVARVGGDEFVLVTLEPPEIISDRLMNSLSQPFSEKGRTVPISVSIGYVSTDRDNRGALSLISDAGIALQVAKAAGRKKIQPFTPELRQNIETIQRLQHELPHALKNGQIEPWFQPQIRLSDGRIHGAEVLARWRHPAHGLLSPDKFLPAAAQAGMMIELDHTIWQSAMRHVQKWQIAGISIPHISLNAAPETISDPHLIERFLLLLHLSGLRSDQIVMEVLETTIINGKDDMAAINIDSLAESGICLELDDFGTGYASLSKLTQLPLTGIKLDRSLIAPLPDPAADSVIRAILALAAELDLHVVAEGIEEDDQARSLNSYGCTIGQGYGFARPMPADAFLGWLKNNGGACKEKYMNVLPIAGQA